MELPHSSQQKGSQTAADGVRKLESEMQPIEPKFYLPGTWTRNSSHAVGQVQFSKFVTFMIARFRSQNGRLDEVPLFVNLLNTEGSFDFMTPALEQIPEFKMEPPHGPQSPCMVLLVQLLQDLPRFNVKEPTTNTAAADSKAKSNEMYENGLSDKEVEVISSTMFGPGSVENSPRKQRLLQSTIELGFPKAALRNAANLAKQNNTEILRDAQGLPSELWVPRNKEVEPIPSRYNSPYSFLADSILPKPSTKYESGTSSSQTMSDGTTSPSPQQLDGSGPSSSEDPPSELLLGRQSPESEYHSKQLKDEIHRDRMTRIAMELRKVDLASLKGSDKSRSSSRCC
ncbi:hypothetical protein MMC22_008215 [Lobaria immixta]|nr:hypothetical protein [Lobaria immixta]